MAHKKLIVAAALVAVASSASFGRAALAYEDNHRKTATTHATTSHSEDVEATLTDAQKRAVDGRKADIKQRIEAKKAAVSTKLADKRLQTCEKRQAKVNDIFTKATERNKKHLAVFQKIEERVKEFYMSRYQSELNLDKNLSVEDYDAAVAVVDQKEAAAIAAIEASTEVTFDCATADGAKPGSAIKEAMQARHAALKEYRTAVKDLILAIKKHHGQQNGGTDQSGTDDGAPSSTGTGTTEPETETEGVR